MMVLLDVVYNHFGPDGNYLHAYCPPFFNEAHHTPWGAAMNFDGTGCKTVREFFVHNALFWIEEYRFDGLRLDAVHAIHDRSAKHITCEIGQALRAGPGRERHVHLVLENDRNEAHKLARDEQGRVHCADAQWNDDLHHGVHVLLTGEADGYYAAFADAPAAHIARSLAEGFAFQGDAQPPRGEPCAHLPSHAFVSFLQNHDQVGNRAFGERLGQLADARRLDAAYACLLLSPHVPMLFMGEEFAASTPFLYFCDFGPGLAEAVTKGRREEFKRFAAFRDEAARQTIPDPNAESTFTASKLDWQERNSPGHAERLALIGTLLALRQRELVPHLGAQRHGGSWRCDGEVIRVEWPLGDDVTWHLLANLGDAKAWAQPARGGETLYAVHVSDDAGLLCLEPGAVLVARSKRVGA
jgi:maltooligosyltrehalose trehalohydrolase